MMGRDLLDILQSILHSATVPTMLSITPGHDTSVASKGRTGKVGGLDLLHIV